MGTMRVAGEVSREHVITDDELAKIRSACRDDDYGRIVRLLILMGRRRDEVGDMTWPELDLNRGLWTIPRERTKNGLPHEVPLSDAALEILWSIPRREGRKFVFGEGQGGFSGWSKSKARLDARIAKTRAVVRPWRLRDLRRTVATRLGELGILPHVVEAILNHVSGHKAGVAGIYNMSAFDSSANVEAFHTRFQLGRRAMPHQQRWEYDGPRDEHGNGTGVASVPIDALGSVLYLHQDWR
jgi:integrase